MLTWEFTGCHRNGNQDAIDVAIVGRLTDLKESEKKQNISSEENNEERSLDVGNGEVNKMQYTALDTLNSLLMSFIAFETQPDYGSTSISNGEKEKASTDIYEYSVSSFDLALEIYLSLQHRCGTPTVVMQTKINALALSDQHSTYHEATSDQENEVNALKENGSQLHDEILHEHQIKSSVKMQSQDIQINPVQAMDDSLIVSKRQKAWDTMPDKMDTSSSSGILPRKLWLPEISD
ncbi:hypothetical protein Tco_0564221 [Tanacetum coccineum]